MRRSTSSASLVDRAPLTLAVATAAAYSIYSLLRHWHFESSAYDLGIFDQTIWHLSRFEIPASTVRGYSNMLGDHFSPVLALFAPLYWIVPMPEGLMVAQAVLLAASILPVWLYIRRRLPAGPSLALCVAYALFWGMQRAAAFDVHEVAFVPLIVAAAIVALDRESPAIFWSAMALLILTKEDLIPLVGGFGLLLLWRGRRREGFAAIAISCVAFAVVVGVVIPAFSDAGQFGYASAYSSTLASPWRIPIAMVWPPLKMRTMLLLVAPFVFLPLASPLALLLVPMLAERFLSGVQNHWGTVFHYWAPIAPVLAMGAADGLVRVTNWMKGADRRREITMRSCAAACVVLSAILPGHQPVLVLFKPAFYAITPAARAGGHSMALIPPDASVVAQGAIIPHLGHRPLLYVLDQHAPDADYVVTSEQFGVWPLDTTEQLRVLIDDRRQRGYSTILEQDGWLVLHRDTRR
jgi:uncharacterized membrane protein